MLPLSQKLLFLLFAAVTGTVGIRGFYRVYRRIAAGRTDPDARFDHLFSRVLRALTTSLTQSRTFRKRPIVSFFHSFIFYGFTFYLLVNLVDAIDGFVPLSFGSLGLAGRLYILAADVLSALVLVGVVALVFRRFFLPARRDFAFNERTLLHPAVQRGSIPTDSLIVSAFILFHIGSRAIGAGAKVAMEGPDPFAPFATLLSHLFTPHNALTWRIFGFWGALGSVLLFMLYFPYSKHLHLFLSPAKYLVTRDESSGVLPTLDLQEDAESPALGAKQLGDLGWPRLLDAYACIQCNRCQDVCPATATGKSLSPSALEINKRMELNATSRDPLASEPAPLSLKPLLAFALTPEAAWACTTCGACIEVCPVADEPMLDIIDIRRHQVMVEGEFPQQLQTAFRGMERAQNPWGINHEKRLDWAEGLNVSTTEQNPEPDVLFWVGCAASYDPQSQKTARAFVQLLQHAGVDFAVLGKRECCTGDSARRAGNEYLYRQLAETNISTLQQVKPKRIVATCPHCLNSVGNEYKQLGGDFEVLHHTEYLETLVAEGRLTAEATPSTVTYHDPCYLGRHNGVYDAPRNLLSVISNSVVELPRNRENSFCCGAGGAQFWKEEEPGSERISDNRFREVQQTLDDAKDKVLAVGCPFCKSMLDSTPARGEEPIPVRDVAELLLEGVQRKLGIPPEQNAPSPPESSSIVPSTIAIAPPSAAPFTVPPEQSILSAVQTSPSQRRKRIPDIDESMAASDPTSEPGTREPAQSSAPGSEPVAQPPERKAWTPKAPNSASQTNAVQSAPVSQSASEPEQPKRKTWTPKKAAAETRSPEDRDQQPS